MEREFTLSNFTLSSAEYTPQVDDSTLFEIYMVSETNRGILLPYAPLTVTWGQLRTSYTISIPMDIYQVVVKGVVDNKEYTKTLPVDMTACLERSDITADCFQFTFQAEVDNPTVHLNLVRGTLLIPRDYAFTIFWDSESISDIGTSINISLNDFDVDPVLHTEVYFKLTHQYTMNKGQTKIISICGSCPMFTLNPVQLNDYGLIEGPATTGGLEWYIDPLGAFRYPLKVIGINNWGQVNMRGFTRFAAGAIDLLYIPQTSIPHPTTGIDIYDPRFCFSEMFYGCGQLGSVAKCNQLFSNFPEVTGFERTFEKCYNMEDLPFDIFYGCTSAVNFINCFSECNKTKPSRYVAGKTYFEDRIYHNGEANYPDPTNEDQLFADTYLKCDGNGCMPVPYWDVFPNHASAILGGLYGCYYRIDFRNYPYHTLNYSILGDYMDDYRDWFFTNPFGT